MSADQDDRFIDQRLMIGAVAAILLGLFLPSPAGLIVLGAYFVFFIATLARRYRRRKRELVEKGLFDQLP